MSATIPRGAVAPHSLRPTVTVTGLDLTTVSAVNLTVQPPYPAASRVWPATILVASVASLTADHPFVSGDTDTPGRWAVLAILTTPAGPVEVICEPFFVLNPSD